MVDALSYKDARGKAKKRAGLARREVAHHADKETIRIFLDKHLKPGSTVHTDGWLGYSDTALLEDRHIVNVQDSPQSASRWAPHIHRVFSNLKAWLLGTYHGIEPQYLQAYLDEFVFRFNRRQRPADGGIPNFAWHQLHERPSLDEGSTLSGDNRISIIQLFINHYTSRALLRYKR